MICVACAWLRCDRAAAVPWRAAELRVPSEPFSWFVLLVLGFDANERLLCLDALLNYGFQVSHFHDLCCLCLASMRMSGCCALTRCWTTGSKWAIFMICVACAWLWCEWAAAVPWCAAELRVSSEPLWFVLPVFGFDANERLLCLDALLNYRLQASMKFRICLVRSNVGSKWALWHKWATNDVRWFVTGC